MKVVDLAPAMRSIELPKLAPLLMQGIDRVDLQIRAYTETIRQDLSAEDVQLTRSSM